MKPDPLQPLRNLCPSSTEAIRWACTLEATAPKAGNVFPGRSFHDLSHEDFVVAAEITSQCFRQKSLRISQRMLNSLKCVRTQRGTNVNLGIVLLLGPLVAADEMIHKMRPSLQSGSRENTSVSSLADWISPVRKAIEQFDSTDGANIYHGIDLAAAGGLGTSEKLDVHQEHETIDIQEAMQLSKDHDSIARQYSCGFHDLIVETAPLLLRGIKTTGDVLSGICHAQIELLARTPDTLIARKNGMQVACEVQSRAKDVDPLDMAQIEELDRYLRSNGNQLNPGTTADMLAAALYLLLRTHSF